MKDNYKLSYVVVDDDEEDRFFMRSALERANRLLPIFEFADGQQVLDYLIQNANERPDNRTHWLVVLDINMPRLNGLETLRLIRQNPYWAGLPVLMLSTSSNPAVIAESLRQGANGYITKPSSIDEYVAIFDQFFAPWLRGESGQET